MCFVSTLSGLSSDPPRKFRWESDKGWDKTGIKY